MKSKYPFCTLQCRSCKRHNGYADREYGDGTTICRRCVKSRKLDSFYVIARTILAQSIVIDSEKGER
jgi:hypothetical protein